MMNRLCETARRALRFALVFAAVAAALGAIAPLAGCADRSHARWQGYLDGLWMPRPAVTSGRMTNVLSIGPGQTVELGEIEGPAVIRRMWFTCQSPIPQIQALLVLRIFWDGESSPSVEVPLGDFFGVGFGKERELKSLMAEMYPAGGENHAALVCHWPMPFAQRARIGIENRGLRSVSMFFAQVDYERREALPPQIACFHARWQRENPVRSGVPYTILETRGRGCYAGTTMNYHLLGPGAWVEGGNDFYIDGSEHPSLPGTGAEDYFGHAWGFRRETQAPTHGTSFGPEGDRMTAYRWHVFDPVWFDRSVRVTMRCHGWDVGDRQDDYSSVAYWYQTEPHVPFPPLPDADLEDLQVPAEYRMTLAEYFAPERLPPSPPGRSLASRTAAWCASGSYDTQSTGDRAFDGRLDTKWCDVPRPQGQWLALDLGGEKILTGFVLKNASMGGESDGYDTSAFRVEVGPSLDGPWTTAASIDNESAPPNPELGRAIDVVRFERPLPARCVRLVITRGCRVDGIARVPEFEVYGEDGPAGP